MGYQRPLLCMPLHDVPKASSTSILPDGQKASSPSIPMELGWMGSMPPPLGLGRMGRTMNKPKF